MRVAADSRFERSPIVLDRPPHFATLAAMHTAPTSNQAPGLFVVFEGIDGSGTTTVSRQVAEMLGSESQWTNEPSTSEFGTKARHFLTIPSTSPVQLAMLFALDRFHHNRFVVEPGIKAGQIVICDRHLLSSLAYQMQDGIDRSVILAMNPALRPDLTIFIRCPVEVAEKRRANRGLAADRRGGFCFRPLESGDLAHLQAQRVLEAVGDPNIGQNSRARVELRVKVWPILPVLSDQGERQLLREPP